MRTTIFFTLLLGWITGNAQVRPAAEVFIEMKEAGKYEVSVGGDYSSSASGRFRFYDILPGYVTVSVTFAGKQLVKKEILTRQGMRTIFSYSRNGELRPVTELPIYQDNRYALDNWNGNMLYTDNRPPDGRPYIREMRTDDFNALSSSLQKETFDEAKIRVMNLALKYNQLSVTQLMELLKKITFDDNKLIAATSSYDAVLDRGNFYRVREVFTFTGTKEKLDAFLLKR